MTLVIGCYEADLRVLFGPPGRSNVLIYLTRIVSFFYSQVTVALSLRCYHVNSLGLTTTPAVSEDIPTTVADASSASTSEGPAANATTQSNNSNATTGETSTTNGSTTNGSTTEKAFTTQLLDPTNAATTEALTIHINTTEASTTQIPTEVSTNEATTKTQTINTSTTEASTTQSPTELSTNKATTKTQTTNTSTTEASTTQSPTEVSTNGATTKTQTTNTSTTEASTTQSPTEVSTNKATTKTQTTNTSTTEASTTQSPTEVSTNGATTKTQTTHTSTTEASTTQSPTEVSTHGATTKTQTTNTSTTEASTTQSPTEGPPTENMPTTNAAATEASITQSPNEVSTNEATNKTQTTNTSTTEASTTPIPTEVPPTENMPTTNAAATEALTIQINTTEASTTQIPTEVPTNEATTKTQTTNTSTTEASTTPIPTEVPPTENMPTTDAAATEASITQSPTEVSTNEATTKTQITLEELLHQVTVNLSLEESQTILEEVQTILDSDSEVAEASDLISLVDVYATIGNTDKLQNATLEDSTSFVQASLSVANSLLDDRYTGFYQDANGSSEAQTISPASKVMSTTEQLMRSLAEQILAEGGESFNSSNDNIATEIKKWDGSGNPEPLSVPAEDQFSTSIATQAIIPAELFKAYQGLAIVSVLYRNLDKVIGNSSQTDVEEVFASGKSGSTSAEIAVLSKVLSISVVPQPADMSLFKNFPVNMTFQTHVKQVNAERPNDSAVDTDTAACVYWDITNSSSGESWSSSGCSFIRGNVNYTMCACRHLTSFAVLMQVRDIKISKPNQMALNIISYIGCSLSVVGVILLVGTFAFLNIHTERVLVHINLAVAVGLARIMFLLLDSPPRHSDACIVVAMVIYYTNMASFFWMLIEGVHLYLQVVVVFNIERSKLRLYMPVAWGVPIILMSVTVGVFSNSIRKSDVCWLQSSDNSIWMFVAPMLAVVAANTFILIRVVRVIFKLTAANATSGLSQTKQVAKATLMLQPVLGVTWIFGVLSLSSSLLIFQYLFTICNSFQGVLLFLFYCVFNSEVQDTFKRRKANWEMFNRSTKSSTVAPLTDLNRSTSYKHPSQGGSGAAVESSVLPLEDIPTFR
ncbi:adhesion G protein-coupled receptor L4-like [Patiria miniata]|uniref:Adhesion G-protein coupled receptor D1-like n=1 Tax=Patiria miniata TaxID=46514 RepID=A0A913ZUZ4_PATMI|nr:adhesion G protein-coupled receptor L4-like [Patiria miniata]